MKILFISSNSPELSVGGVERHIKNLIDYCVRNNEESVFLLPSRKKESNEKIGNVTIIKKDFLNLSYRKLFNKKEIPRAEIKKKSKDFFDFIKRLIKERNIKIVNAQNFQLGLPPIYSLMLNMVCFLENVPMVVRMHSFLKTEMQKSLINDLFWEKVLCVSKSVAGDCFNKGIGVDRIRTQYLGVNRKDFRPFLDKLWLRKQLGLPDNTKVILHASRIISGAKDILKEKGIAVLLESFSQIVNKNPLVRLVIAVATPPQHLQAEFHYALDKIKGYIQLHNIEGKTFIKEFRLEDMPLVYNGADVFVLASENETFGQVYTEAMACGIPVIGTNTGGVPEIISDGFNGFLVAPNNPSNLSHKIEEVLNNENLRKGFIENGFKTIRRNFSSERQLGIMFSYLGRLVSREN